MTSRLGTGKSLIFLYSACTSLSETQLISSVKVIWRMRANLIPGGGPEVRHYVSLRPGAGPPARAQQIGGRGVAVVHRTQQVTYAMSVRSSRENEHNFCRIGFSSLLSPSVIIAHFRTKVVVRFYIQEFVLFKSSW